MKNRAKFPSASPGFTLVEMAIVLAIVGLLLGGLLVPLSAQMDQQKISGTRKTLDEIKQALIGYAVANRHFPCPAKSASDGSEDRDAGGACNKRRGFIPWNELGTEKSDAWGRLISYSVTLAYANSASSFGLNTARDITISTRDTADALVNLSNVNDIPVVILSHGNNGFGATSEGGVVLVNPSATNADEQTNLGGGTNFVAKDPSSRTTGSGEFDDLVTWISPNVLFNRMVSAGILP